MRDAVETTALEPVVSIKGDEVIADSRDVAAYFEKEHKHVLEAIDNLLKLLQAENSASGFSEIRYFNEGQNREARYFELNKRAFSLLAMRFTGAKALRWQIRYVAAFETMEAELLRRAEEDEFPCDADGRLFGLSVAKVNAAARLASSVAKLYGPAAARRMLESEPGLAKFMRRDAPSVGGGAADNPAGCFKRLLRAAAGNGLTVGQVLTLAIRDKAAAKALRAFGLLLDPQGASGYLAVANDDAFLSKLYAETQWCGAWRIALLQLPQARPSGGNINFNGKYSRAVLIPRAEVLALLSPAS